MISMSENGDKTNKPPEFHPYIVSALLLGFGLWCFWDGWISADAGYKLFNRIASAVLIGYAFIDFFIWRKRLIKYKNEETE